MITPRPFGVFARRDFFPERDDVGILHDFGRITFDVMPKAGVQAPPQR